MKKMKKNKKKMNFVWIILTNMITIRADDRKFRTYESTLKNSDYFASLIERWSDKKVIEVDDSADNIAMVLQMFRHPTLVELSRTSVALANYYGIRKPTGESFYKLCTYTINNKYEVGDRGVFVTRFSIPGGRLVESLTIRTVGVDVSNITFNVDADFDITFPSEKRQVIDKPYMPICYIYRLDMKSFDIPATGIKCEICLSSAGVREISIKYQCFEFFVECKTYE